MDSVVQHAVSKTATDALNDLWNSKDPWDYDPAALLPLQLEALRERFTYGFAHLKVLQHRAEAENVKEINNLEDVIPLLFSHTSYKSYPASFVQNGRWDMMTRWLGTLSTAPVDNVALDAVRSIDDWVAALHEAGHLVIASSGTTGQSSFVNQTAADRLQHTLSATKMVEVSCGVKPEPVFGYFWSGPNNGRNMGAEQHRLMREVYGKAGDRHFLSEHDLSVGELDKLASIRKAIAEGTATPDLIADAESTANTRLREVEAQIQRFIGELFEHRDSPVLLFAGWSMLWRIVDAGRSMGLADGTALHPDSVIRTGGGKKGFRGPENFRADAEAFFGIAANRWVDCYGMTELSTQFYTCEHLRYHTPPTTLPLILDKAGEQLIDPVQGVAEGRGGFFDLAVRGRWGGVISGDRVTMDFEPCPCGRKSPSIRQITRYKDLPEGDDRLTCAGQIDTYVRGVAGGDWQ